MCRRDVHPAKYIRGRGLSPRVLQREHFRAASIPLVTDSPTNDLAATLRRDRILNLALDHFQQMQRRLAVQPGVLLDVRSDQ